MDLNNRIQQVLAGHGDIRLAILFGSLAGGRATPQSDLDLAVLMEVPLSADDWEITHAIATRHVATFAAANLASTGI